MNDSRSNARGSNSTPGAFAPVRRLFAKLGLTVLFRPFVSLVNRLADAIYFYRTGAARHEQAYTLGVFLSGIFLATYAYFWIQDYYRTEAQQQLNGPAGQFTALIEKTVDNHVGAVNSVAAFIAASEKPGGDDKKLGRWEFFEFVDEILPRFPGIRALQWIPRVGAADRDRYEHRASEDGLFGFRFTTRDRRGTATPVGENEEYYPVFFVEPFEGNEATLGWDLASNPGQREILELARDLGTMVATRAESPRMMGRRSTDHRKSLITVVLPIFDGKQVPETLRERRRKLAGFARGVLHIGDMLNAALPALTAPPGLDIYVFDQDARPGKRLLHYHPSPLRPGRPRPLPERETLSGLFTAMTHELAGWQWVIAVKPVASPFTINVTTASLGLWALILMCTALAVQFLVSTQTRRVEIEHRVEERTAELSEANESLSAEIQERKRVEVELRRAKDQAEVANRAKSEFLAMMSHELRTPLNAVIGFSEILSKESLGPIGSHDYRTYAEDIRLSGTHLLSLINDILDLSKIEAERFELSDDRVDLAETLHRVLPVLQDKIAEAGHKLEVALPETLPRLRADQRALRQILINMLSNAVKFTPHGGTITVLAAVTRDGGLVVRIADTGIGISEPDLEAVLLPFNQVDSSLARKYEGTGLGLPLSKRLMELHGGTLELDSTLGVGTTVSLVFPPERLSVRGGAGGELVPAPASAQAVQSGQIVVGKSKDPG